MLTTRWRTQPWRPHRRPTAACFAIAISIGFTGSATPVAASPLTAERAQAARVMAQLDLLQTQHDAAAARESAASARLEAARALAAASAVQVAATEQSLAASRSALASTLVSSYKSNSEDAFSFMLAAGSFSDFVTRVDVLHRAAAGDTELINQISATERVLAKQQSVRRAAVADAVLAHADAVAAERSLAHAIASRRGVLARVSAVVRQLLAREAARRRALASSGGGSTGGGTGSGGGGSGGGSSGGSGGGSSGGSVFYGECSWYGPGFAGHPTASGEPFDPNALTAASPWLPFGTQLKVTNLSTGLSVQVRVNDRGPFGRGVLDLSAHAAQIVHLSGWQRVRIQILSSGPQAARSVMP